MNNWIAAVINVLNRALPDSVAINSPNYLLRTRGGITVCKAMTLSGNGANADDIFVLTGMVEIFEILFHVTEATNSTVLSGLKFELYDSTASVDITAAVNASGIVVDGMVYKRGLAAQAAVMLNAAVGSIAEAAANKVSFEPFFAVKKSGAATSIRLIYTGDANTDVDVMVDVRYRPHTADGALVAS